MFITLYSFCINLQQNVNGNHLQTNTQPFNPIVASHHGQNSDVFDVVTYENNNKTKEY